jgi:hypothetical protein
VPIPSLAKLKPNPDWANLPVFDRKRGSRLRFGGVVENVNERVEPSTTADDIYVGLDDLDSGNLNIRRWGDGSDIIETKLGFRNYKIIFGRRRAYQRKLPMAEVDALQAEVDALKHLQTETDTELDALLPAILDKAFKGEL